MSFKSELSAAFGPRRAPAAAIGWDEPLDEATDSDPIPEIEADEPADANYGLPDEDWYPPTTRPSDEVWPRTEMATVAGYRVLVEADIRRRSVMVNVPVLSSCAWTLSRLERDGSLSTGFLIEAGQGGITLGSRSSFVLIPFGTPTGLAPAYVSVVVESWWATSATDPRGAAHRRRQSMLAKLAELLGL